MKLSVRNKKECTFDEISLGEVMLRMDPGEGRIKCTRRFQVWEGGGEYNVARALRKCFGMKTGIVTSLVDNPVGRLIEDFIMQGGVDTSMIQWLPFDGVGYIRNGLNFTERGYGVRGALGMYDRAHSAASKMCPDTFDWDYIFGTLGVRWLHTGGIFAALSATASETLITAVKSAKKYGTIVSYDLNYRPSMWKEQGGLDRAREVNREIARYVDVMIGNEEDFTACLGIEIEGNDEKLSHLNISGYEKMISRLVELYPNISVVATTLRGVKTATVNDWEAICWYDGKMYRSHKYADLEIFDRVGGGDGFASGFVYGMLETGDPQTAVEYGAAHGALAMTTPGDTSMASLNEVRNLANGGSARVIR